MEIITKIKPLYEDLVEQHFVEYIKTNDFVRLCNDIGITDEWTAAFNEGSKAEPVNDPFFNVFVNTLNYDAVLALLLNKLYSQKAEKFNEIIGTLLINYLEWAPKYVLLDKIIKDLKSTGLDNKLENRLEIAWGKQDNNHLKKVKLLKGHLVGRAANEPYNDSEYESLRQSLLTKPAVQGLLPYYVLKSTTLQDFWYYIKPTQGYKERRKFIQETFAPLIQKLEKEPTPIAHSIIINNEYVHIVWQKALERMSVDPEAAITSARTLLETVCKFILDESRHSYDDGIDLPALYRTTASLLNLSPDQHTESIFKQILGGCQSVINGLGSIRNKLGDAHGISQRRVRPSTRHATLAVNLSGAMCQFLLESFNAKG